jgi:hypothetical protein
MDVAHIVLPVIVSAVLAVLHLVGLRSWTRDRTR